MQTGKGCPCWSAQHDGGNYIRTSAISFFCDAGRGHFDVSDQLVDYIAMFLKKAVQYRLPKESPIDWQTKLLPVNPEKGWLKERWKKDEKPRLPAAPYSQYKGDREKAFLYFDQEMTETTEKYYARVRGKKRAVPRV